MSLRSLYVAVVRAKRSALRRLGLLDALADSRWSALRYVRTLFAIYDAADLASLDLPWWNYRTIRLVERFLADRPGARVFEYGSGASTAWLARRAGSVHTVEHDPDFAAAVAAMLADRDHVRIEVVAATPAAGRAAEVDVVRSERAGAEGLDFGDYVRAIDAADGPFDLIVVDGRARVASFRRALPHLAPDGLIVFDDVERPRYAPALREPGLRVHVLRGLTPCLPYPTSTALLRRVRS